MSIARDAKELIDANVQDPLSFSEMAGLLGTTQKKLGQKFRLQHGVTMTAYLRTARGLEIKRLVETSHYTITDIAKEVGISYESVSAIFYEVSGMSVPEYRRAHPFLEI